MLLTILLRKGKRTYGINNDSELGINVSGAVPTEVVESAVTGDKTMDDLVQEWNEKWTSAQENNGITVD